MAAATDAIDDAVPGYGGLFEPTTTRSELRRALEDVIDSAVTQPPIPEAANDEGESDSD